MVTLGALTPVSVMTPGLVGWVGSPVVVVEDVGRFTPVPTPGHVSPRGPVTIDTVVSGAVIVVPAVVVAVTFAIVTVGPVARRRRRVQAVISLIQTYTHCTPRVCPVLGPYQEHRRRLLSWH